MIKRIKAMVMAVLMATIFPLLRIGAPPVGDKVEETPAAPVEPPAAPAKSPEERVKELEGELAGKSARITELELLATGNKTENAKLGDSLKGAIAGYKGLVIAANPDVLPELITGETIEELSVSLAKGKELTVKVKANLDLTNQKKRVPAGAPPRSPEDLSGLSAREKINRGLSK